MLEALCLTQGAPVLNPDYSSFNEPPACVSGPPDRSQFGYSDDEKLLSSYGCYAIEDCIITTNVSSLGQDSIEEYLLQYRRRLQSPNSEVVDELSIWLAARPRMKEFIESSEREFSAALGIPVSVQASLFKIIDDDESDAFVAGKLTIDYGADFKPAKIIELEKILLEGVIAPIEDQLEDTLVLNSIHG